MDVHGVLTIVGSILIGVGVLFMVFGAVGLFKFKDFYPRILISSKIDTVGLLTLFGGVALRYGLSFFSGKVLLIVIIILILNPLVAHIVTGSAYESGYGLEGTISDEIEDAEGQNTDENREDEVS